MAMALDAALVQHLRLGTGELWRGMRVRAGLRLLLSLLVVYLAFYGMVWLLGEAWFAGRGRDVAVALARIFLPAAGVCAGCAMALVDSLSALIVSGPFLRSMGDLFLCARAQAIGPDVTAEFGVFGSPRALAGMARIRDLPLIVFLARIVLGVNVKPLLHAAQGGLDAETLVRELERHARDRAAGMLRRLRIALYVLVGLAVLFPFLVGTLLG
jgi:hypothetical protein